MNMQPSPTSAVPADMRHAPDIAQQLIENGYRPVPCKGKRALPTGWTKHDSTAKDFEPGQNVGIKTGKGQAFLDLDILDEEISRKVCAEWVRRYPDPGMQRTGKAPKTGFLIGCDLNNKITLNLPNKDKVEVLANGQQFVAFGIHPDTGAPYHWHGLNPLDTFLGVASALPKVSEADLRDFIDWIDREVNKPKVDEPLSVRARAAAGLKIDTGTSSGKFWDSVNEAALANLGAWVPVLFPTVQRPTADGCWRVPSRDLGRDLQEDLSLHPTGIQDFGEERGARAIDIVMQFGGAPEAKGAAFWLCEKMGHDPSQHGWTEGNPGKPKRSPASRGVPIGTGDIEVTEDGIARAFTAKYGNILRFDHDAGKWFEWTGDHWQREGTNRAMHYCRELARNATVDAGSSEIRTARKFGFARGVEAFTRADPAHAVTQDTWDSDPWLLGCKGVTVDLRTGQARAADPADGITKRAAVAPAATADCPQWMAFLDQSTGGDVEMIRFLKQWAGYSLTGITREHALVFIYGDGGNGKGVFVNTVAGILGDYATAAAMATFTASKVERHATELAALRGARLVTASETEEGRAWAESRIKQLTGGDTIKARFMHKDEFEFKPQFKLTIMGNHSPVLKNVDAAMRRRFNIVPFNNKPTTPDPSLEEKLRAEWPGILRWMIEGTLDWNANGLTRPSGVSDATEAYFEDQDVVGQFLAGHDVELDNPSKWETARDIYSAWTDYAKQVGEEPGTEKRLGEALRKRGFEKDQKRVGGVNLKCYTGIQLNRGVGN